MNKESTRLRGKVLTALYTKKYVKGDKKALEIIPDLILTDLMMPKMDGGELCLKIRSNDATSHIPIIMLTTKDTLDDKISGLQSGADDYISKPFHMAELRVRQEMNLSRSTLSRKLHALTGQSPTEFIRTIRLKRAASLLDQNFPQLF